MKTMANCSPVEFLSQGYKVIDKASELIKKSNVLEIRKRMPKLDADMNEAKKKILIQQQSKENIMDMIKVLMNDFPQETAEVLGLMCFIEPEDLENHKGIEFLTPAVELLTSEEVLSFFTSLGLVS